MLISNWNDALIIQFGIGFQFQLEMIICLVEKSTKVYSISNLELDSNWIPIPNWNDQNIFPILEKSTTMNYSKYCNMYASHQWMPWARWYQQKNMVGPCMRWCKIHIGSGHDKALSHKLLYSHVCNTPASTWVQVWYHWDLLVSHMYDSWFPE